jgi:hypothetical protein
MGGVLPPMNKLNNGRAAKVTAVFYCIHVM